MVDVPFKNSPPGKLLFGAAGARKPTIGTLGESHGTSQGLVGAIHYALFRYYAADVVFDTRTFANGGSVFAVGGTQTNSGANSLLSTQVPNFLTKPTDIAFIASGYNDLTSGVAPVTIRDNVLSAANQLLAAGAMVVVIMGMMPRGGGSGANMANTMQVNALYKKMCNANPRLIFCEVTNLVADPTATNAYRGPQGNVFGSYSSDGTHLSGRGQRAIAPAIANILKLFCAERKPRGAFPALLTPATGAYNAIAYPYSNIFGDVGAMMGTQGLLNDASFPGTVAGLSSNSRLAVFDGGGTLATSIITDAADGGRRKQQLVYGGTQTQQVQLRVDANNGNANAGDGTRYMDCELVVELSGMTGLTGISMRPNGSVADDVLTSWQGGPSDRMDANTTETWFMYTTYPVPVPASNPSLQMYFLADGPLSGTIKLSQLSAMIVQGGP